MDNPNDERRYMVSEIKRNLEKMFPNEFEGKTDEEKDEIAEEILQEWNGKHRY